MNTMSLINFPTNLGSAEGYSRYLNYVRSFPLLSEEEEKTLFIQFKQENDLAAARKIILSHLRFVVHIARGYMGYGLPLEDLVQEGTIGLMKSVKRFDLSFGVRLASFAMYWIKAEINEYIMSNWRLVKVGTTKARRKLFFNLRRMKSRLSWLSSAETKTIAEKLQVSEEDVTEFESLLNAPDAYFDTTFGDVNQDEFQPGQVGAYALADESHSPHLLIEHKLQTESSKENLALAIQSLDARSRDIVESRWLDAGENKLTLTELAERYGVSAERVRQIESAALRKLKKLMTSGNEEAA